MNKRSMKEYRIWKGMKARCYAPSFRDSYYQQDGIQVCDRWRNDFNAFLADMGSIPGPEYSIERIDLYGDYCPENCKWIPMRDQMKNRRNVPVYEYAGERHCLKEWSTILGFNLSRVRGRIRRGCSFDDAIKEDLYKRQVVIRGVSKTVKEWCQVFNLNTGNIYSRIHRGWSKEDAILMDQNKVVIH